MKKSKTGIDVMLAFKVWQERQIKEDAWANVSQAEFLRHYDMNIQTFLNYKNMKSNNKMIDYANRFKDDLGLSMDELIKVKK
jgi:transcription initiation factor TFIIIB Brf1 subunit/transcription initiation factor TFIIB